MFGFDLRKYERKRRAARIADTPRRLAALTTEAAAMWIATLRAARPVASQITPTRPCDYAPWVAALSELANRDGGTKKLGRYYYADASLPEHDRVWDLMSFAADASVAGWPDEHGHLVDFALAFLEADVMLFRSGYYKRHLLRRLRQADLDDRQTHRARALIQRAVLLGTGLEEYKEFCRLAARLVDEPLREWLTQTSQGAYLTLDLLGGDDLSAVYRTFDDQMLGKISRYDRKLRLTNAFPADLTAKVVKVSDLPESNRVKRNAWRMLRHIEKVEQSRKS